MFTVVQVVLADPYLTKRTLVYQNGSRRGLVYKTPWWMVLVWFFAVFISGIWHHYLSFSYSLLVSSAIFLITGFLLFLVVELTVNNYFPDKLWKRKNCRQSFNVAHYAILAEFATVILLCLVFPFIADAALRSSEKIAFGGAVSTIAALIFAILCSASYNLDSGA